MKYQILLSIVIATGLSVASLAQENVFNPNNPNPPTNASDIEMAWSSTGKISGMYCIEVREVGDPYAAAWYDNYLCFNRPDHGVTYSQGGLSGGNNCISLNLKGGVWTDNQLCSRYVELAFFPRNLPGGYTCHLLTEGADPDPRVNGSDGYSNHICIKR